MSIITKIHKTSQVGTARWGQMWQTYVYWGGSLLLALMSTYGFWATDGLPSAHDGLTHVFRLYALDQAIRSGTWYPTRFPDFGFGYGFSILAYYPPLVLYVMEFFRLMGLGIIVSYKLGCTVLALVAASTMFWFGTALRGPRMGLVAAFVYTYSPYLLYTLYRRGGSSEYAALALVPLVFLALHRAVLDPQLRNLLLLGGSGALLILAHFLSVILFLPFLVLYTLFLLWQARQCTLHTLGRLFGASLLAVVLSAFYWLPAYWVRGGVRIPDAVQALDFYMEGFLPLAQIVRAQFWMELAYDDIPHLANLPLTLLLLAAVAGVAAWYLRGRTGRMWAADHALYGAFGLGLLLATGLISLPNQPLLRWLSFFSILQFPFRWLGPASLCLAVLVGAAMTQRLWRGVGGWSWTGLMAVLLVAFGLSAVPALGSMSVDKMREEHINAKGILALEQDAILWLAHTDWSWSLEYVPESSALKDIDRLAPLILKDAPVTTDLPPVQTRVQPQVATPNRLVVQAQADESWTLSLHAFFVPGWQATINGVLVPVRPVSDLGMVGVDVPAGVHEVVLWYDWIWQRHLAAVLSVVAVAAWLLMAVRRQPWWAAGVVAVCLAFGLLGYGAQTKTPSPPPIQAADAEFDGVLTLSGYGLALADETILLDLVWLTRRSPLIPYKTFIHILDDTGTLWAQADAHPLNFASRVNRWIPGQVVTDPHRIPLPASMLPGRYQVRIGLYNEQDGARLPVVNDLGEPIDDQVLLGYIEVSN
jgi:hypothetical protein